jgi:hypothetical protein
MTDVPPEAAGAAPDAVLAMDEALVAPDERRIEDNLDYPFDAPPVFGTSREVAPGVRWVRMPLPSSLGDRGKPGPLELPRRSRRRAGASGRRRRGLVLGCRDLTCERAPRWPNAEVEPQGDDDAVLQLELRHLDQGGAQNDHHCSTPSPTPAMAIQLSQSGPKLAAKSRTRKVATNALPSHIARAAPKRRTSTGASGSSGATSPAPRSARPRAGPGSERIPSRPIPTSPNANPSQRQRKPFNAAPAGRAASRLDRASPS